MNFCKIVGVLNPEVKYTKSQPISRALHAYADLVSKRVGAPAPRVGGRPMIMLTICIVLLIFHCYMAPFVHIFLGHERDRFEITPVISSNVEYVAVALCGRLWGTFLGYLKENLDKFQGKQVLSHSFPKMKRISCPKKK